MITALQIALLLILIALIGIILGYLFGKLSCKKQVSDIYFQKNDYCENDYVEKNGLLSNLDSEESSILSNTTVENQEPDNLNEKSETIEKVEIMNQAADEDSKSKESSNNTNTETLNNVDDENVNNIQEPEKEIKNIDSSEEEDKDKPAILTEPRDGKADNLCRIKGIGFVIEEKLHKLGVFHFDQIAAWTENEVKWIDSHLAFSGRILREDWIGQAKKLAQGEDTEFSKRVDKGEVSTSRKTKDNEK